MDLTLENLPTIDLVKHSQQETATFSMGYFWTPEAIFGATEGVIRTRVGYAGGQSSDPTYRNMGDHIETVQLDFNPEIISFSKLLNIFFQHHTPTKEPRKRQYASALFYHAAAQQTQIKQAIKAAEEKFDQPILTEVLPLQGFYLAEERHQKWKLRRATAVLQELQRIYPDFEKFNKSTVVARVNGYLSGFGDKGLVMEEIGSLGLSSPVQQMLLAHYLTQENPLV
ncbi:peptide-methionine (S)-S-oxide reductase MsrA [Rufibacter sp. LB8]|uniref:peptide-methionine (S)-S-oxide reductase MsrA n=1 Tax=Rufibacter sp. LB8 TaxID=2777781 RepID=UPI00178C76AE|nr:peptide-methionine (S)-S-oxide reductase MsrA [Rufibacter sp. LB8]